MGHLAIGLAARGGFPRIRVPLFLLLVAAFGPDWIEIIFKGFSAPDTPMLSHSLPAAALGLVAFSLIAALATRSLAGTMLVAGVFTLHILCDYLTGHKPTWPGGPMIGLHLYQRPLLDFFLEAGVILGAGMVYRRSLPPGRQNSPLLYVLSFALLAAQGVFDWKFAT